MRGRKGKRGENGLYHKRALERQEVCPLVRKNKNYRPRPRKIIQTRIISKEGRFNDASSNQTDGESRTSKRQGGRVFAQPMPLSQEDKKEGLTVRPTRQLPKPLKKKKRVSPPMAG